MKATYVFGVADTDVTNFREMDPRTALKVMVTA
jgi:hypothetical protein